MQASKTIEQKDKVEESTKNGKIKRYRIDGKTIREIFPAYEEIFAKQNPKQFEKFKRSSQHGVRGVLMKEDYEFNPVFILAIQTPKLATTIILSKTHNINYNESLDFFKKIKKIFNEGGVFDNLDQHTPKTEEELKKMDDAVGVKE